MGKTTGQLLFRPFGMLCQNALEICFEKDVYGLFFLAVPQGYQRIPSQRFRSSPVGGGRSKPEFELLIGHVDELFEIGVGARFLERGKLGMEGCC